MIRPVLCASALLLTSLASSWALAETQRDAAAAELLPATTGVYAELVQPKQVVDLIWNHPLKTQVKESPEFQAFQEKPEYFGFLIAVKVVEKRLGMDWRTAVAQLTDGGLHFAADPATDGVAILAGGADSEVVKKSLGVLVKLAQEDAKNKGKADPVESKDYRGLTAYKIDEPIYVVLGRWLLITNKPDLAKQIADAYLDGADKSLADKPGFADARGLAGSKHTAWGYVDLNVVRSTGDGAQLRGGQTDNPAAELLAGGVLSALQEAAFAVMTLDLDAEGAALEFAVPFKKQWVQEPREFYFRPEAVMPYKPLKFKNPLFSMSTYRDLGGMWLAKEDLFEERVVAELAEADSNLSTLFGGRDFGQEILGALKPQWQIVATRQKFSEDYPAPSVKLPAFAMVGQLKDPEKMRKQLKISYQSLIAFVNIFGPKNGQPQLELKNEQVGDATLVSATYLVEEGDEDQGRIVYNFSPSIGFSGDWFVFASTKALAREALETAADSQARQEPLRENVRTELNLATAREILSDNREQLIAQNMLEKGHDREAAEVEIGRLLQGMRLLDGAGLSLEESQGALRLKLGVTLGDLE